MEDRTRAEAIRLRERNSRKLQLVGPAIGVLVVILLAIWLAYHP